VWLLTEGAWCDERFGALDGELMRSDGYWNEEHGRRVDHVTHDPPEFEKAGARVLANQGLPRIIFFIWISATVGKTFTYSRFPSLKLLQIKNHEICKINIIWDHGSTANDPLNTTMALFSSDFALKGNPRFEVVKP